MKRAPMASPSNEKSSPLALPPPPHRSSLLALLAVPLLARDSRAPEGMSTVSTCPLTISRMAASSEARLLLACSSSPGSNVTSCTSLDSVLSVLKLSHKADFAVSAHVALQFESMCRYRVLHWRCQHEGSDLEDGQQLGHHLAAVMVADGGRHLRLRDAELLRAEFQTNDVCTTRSSDPGRHWHCPRTYVCKRITWLCTDGCFVRGAGAAAIHGCRMTAARDGRLAGSFVNICCEVEISVSTQPHGLTCAAV